MLKSIDVFMENNMIKEEWILKVKLGLLPELEYIYSSCGLEDQAHVLEWLAEYLLGSYRWIQDRESSISLTPNLSVMIVTDPSSLTVQSLISIIT